MLLLSTAAARADYDKGQTAWDAGRHVEAVREWRAAARANNIRAMFALGRAYARGLGVTQDFVEAHKWLNLAAGRGSAEAAAERDKLAAEMTAGERAEARKLARAWRSGGAGTATVRPSATPPKSAAAPAGSGTPPARALKEAQTLLAALGYRPGTPDGKWGRRSIQAYRDFLRDAGMEPSDMLTPSALRAMRRMARDRQPTARVAPKPAMPAKPAGGLHQAVKTGNLDGLQAALKGKVDVNVRDARGWTPLMYAVDKGYVLMLPPLLKAGAEVNLRAPDGATALFIAALHGRAKIVDQLMKAGADASLKGPKGMTAIDLATSKKDPDLVAMFLSSRAKKLAEKLGRDLSPRMVDGNGWTDLHYAAALNLPVLAKLLLVGGADPNARLKSDGKPLGGRLSVNLRELEYTLTDERWRFGQTPLHLAGAQYQAVKALVEGGADVNADKRGKYGSLCCPPLYAVLSQEKTDANSEVVKLLIASGADVNAPTYNGGTMLHQASTASLVERLVSLGADVNARDKKYGKTPLHYAAASFGPKGWSKYLAVAETLLNHGADVNVRDNHGRTPLIAAQGGRGSKMYELLLRRGADAKAADKKGRTALYEAIDEGDVLVAKMLIDHGANINARWYKITPVLGGRVPWLTPLHSAIIETDIEMVKFLVDNGADIGARTYAISELLRPVTPVEYAEYKARDRKWSDRERQKVGRIAELLGGHSGGQEEPEESHGD